MSLSDLEISKALALAIGWKPEQVMIENRSYGTFCLVDHESHCPCSDRGRKMNTRTDHHEVVDTDKPLVTFEGICDALQMLLVILGMLTLAANIGLLFGGFFLWVAQKFPDGLLAQLIGG
jgi:hypothetical protein